MTDLCKMFQPLYKFQNIPVAMSPELYNNLSSKHRPNTNKKLSYTFEVLSVYVMQQNANEFETHTLLYDNVVRGLSVSVDDLFEVWCDTLYHTITLSDFTQLSKKDVLNLPVKDIRHLDFSNIDTTLSKLNQGFEMYKQVKNVVAANIVFSEKLVTLSLKKVGQDKLSVLSSWDKNMHSISEQQNRGVRTEFRNYDNNLAVTQITINKDIIQSKIYKLCLLLYSKQNFLKKLQLLRKPLEPRNGFLTVEAIPEFPLLKTYASPSFYNNTCYLNNAVICLFMFPCLELLKVLYQKEFHMQHLLNTSKNLCLGSHTQLFKIQRSYLDPRKLDSPVTLIDSVNIAEFEMKDYYRRCACVRTLRDFHKALNTSGSNLSVARDDFLKSTIECQALSSNPIVGEGEMGEGDSIVELVQDIFSLESMNEQKQDIQYFKNDNDTQPGCVSKSINSIALLYPITVSTNNFGPNHIYHISQLLVSNSNEEEIGGQFSCNEENLYSKRVTTKEFSTMRMICFTFSRIDFSNQYQFVTKICPDKSITFNDTTIYLRAVLIIMVGHYTCCVYCPPKKCWLSFNGGKQNVIGTYDQLLQDRTLVQTNGSIYFYSTDATE